METLFLITAGLGVSLLVMQFLAGLLGFGADHGDFAEHDVDFDDDVHGDANWFFGFLSFRALAAAIAFFGLGGMTALYYEFPETRAFATAVLSALAVLYLVGTSMKFLKTLKADGTVRMKNAVGRTGTVYLRVPASKEGPGKVTLNIQNRTVEIEAYTLGNALPTGTPVRVTNLVGAEAVEVEALTGGQ